MSFAAKQKTIADNIVDLSKKYPSVLDDYRKLVQYYWYYVDGLKVFIPMEQLEKLTQPESIGRAFRKLVEQHAIEVSEDTKIKRASEQRNFRKYYGKGGEGSV